MRSAPLDPLPATDPLVGRVVGGFAVEGVLGRGGFATVYRATSATGAPAALKCLRVERAQQPAERSRFTREAQVLSRLRGPGVARLLGFGHLASGLPDPGRPWLAQSLVAGVSLAERLRRGPPPGPAEALRMIDEALAVLHAVHAAGVVHRDLNPSHLLLAPGGVILVDFGLAHTLDPRDAWTTFTTTGAAFGTPHYMAPEQIDGRAPVGPTTDLYAVGVMLFELLAGRRPFDGLDPLTIMRAHLGGPPPMPPAIPAPLAAVLRRALATAPAARWATARGLRAALADAGEASQTEVGGPGLWRRVRQRLRRG